MARKKLTRKDFVSNVAKITLGASIMPSMLLSKPFESFNAKPDLFDDYKVLICFFQVGGNDSYNMLIPYGESEYNQYSKTRAQHAIAKQKLLPIYPTNTGNREFALHFAMPEMQNLFNDGKLSFISNIGTLIQPTTAQQAQDGSVPLPLGLFSHVDQQQEWMTGRPHQRVIRGWGGRIADSMKSQNPQSPISMNISLAGTNIFQNGVNTIEFSIGNENDIAGITGYGHNSYDGYDQLLTKGIDSLLNYNYTDPFKKSYTDVIRNSNDALKIYKNAMDNTQDLSTEFSFNSTSNAFKTVAKLIKANSILGFKRQIYYIESNGWDHHDRLAGIHDIMLREVSKAFGEFNSAMEELNMQDNVTVFSMSDFGRTLTSNGNGTDHAWGGNVFVMGGAVNGKKIYGDYPVLNLDSDLMMWDGVIVPGLSTDEYFTELAQWFGADNSLLSDIFPNLANFYNINSGQKPIGFLNY